MSVEQLIYTDLPRGRGIAPARAGYQIKACSDGLSTDARRQLDSVCMHYGDAVYAHAPRAAKDREADWRRQTDSLNVVPDEVLNEFPIIWSYDQLADDLFALTQVCYIGLTHDRRPGNFFAHARAFSPDNLGKHDFNPLALSHSELFQSNDTSEDTSLPALQDLGSAADYQPDYQILRRAHYREYLAAMVSALCTATPSTRPVLVCLDDWHQAAPLVEALLNLLPPTARCRTTFCTYESDRKWLIPTATGGRPANQVAAHHLLVIYGGDGRPFNLGPDEYNSTFAVFNFVERQFSSNLGEPRPYAEFVATCLSEGRPERIKHHHKLVEQFEVSQHPDAWDTLAPAAGLLDEKLSPDALQDATQSLVAIATQSSQAQTALELLLPHVQKLAAADDSAVLTTLNPNLGALADLAADAGQEQTQDFVLKVSDLAGKAFAEGRGRTTEALLKACGRAREDALLALLNNALSTPQATLASSPDAADREKMVDLLLDGLQLAEKTPDAAPPVARLLVETFRVAASEAARVSDVWGRIGETLVKPLLRGDWDAEKQQLAKELVARVPADSCPDANAWLNLKLLEATKPEGDKLLASLATIASACSRCTDAEQLTEDVLRIAQEQVPEQQRAEAQGRMAEAAYGTASEEKFFTAYQEEMKQLEPNHHVNIHKELAKAGVVHVLCRDILDDVLPWEEKDSHKKFKSWQKEVLRPHPKVLDGVCEKVASLLAQPGQAETTFLLAERLIPKPQDKLDSGSGLVALYSAVALALPLEPLSKEWRQLLTPLPGGVAPEARARLEVLKFMSELENRAKNQNWSTTQFPHDKPAWGNISKLDPGEKSKVLEWCIDTFATTGVTTPEEAEGLVTLLNAAGEKSPDNVADAVEQLLNGRDQVTRVLAATAFARCFLEGSKQQANWTAIVSAILERFDKSTRRLFEAHLEHRFCRPNRNYEERMRQLREAIRLSSAEPETPSTEDASAESKQRSSVTEILDKTKRSVRSSWRKLLGGQD